MKNRELGKMRLNGWIALIIASTGVPMAGLSLGAQEASEEAADYEADTTETLDEEDSDSEEATEEILWDEDEEVFYNWVTVGVGGVFVDGDEAAFQRRANRVRDVDGGIEQFHYEQWVGDGGLLQMDGKAIFLNRDYKFSLDLSNEEIGFIRAGYRQFRTWYDGSGGFYPLNETWISLYDETLSVDRGKAWFEAGLTLPDMPLITLGYTYDYRRGKKDSTIWGDTARTVGGVVPPVRGIVPSFLDIDERRHSLKLDVEDSVGRTDIGVGVRYEFSEMDDSLNIRRHPGGASDRHLTQKEGMDTDMLNARAHSTTRFNEQWTFTSGYAFTTLDTDISGSRIYGTGYDPIYDPNFNRRQFRDQGFFDLAGGSQMKQHVVNLNLVYRPFDSFAVVPSVRIEKLDTDSQSSFIGTQVGSGLVLSEDPTRVISSNDRLEISERLEMRYTGLKDWVFYGRGDWTHSDGDMSELQFSSAPLFRDTEEDRLVQKYTLGANWYPIRKLSLGLQYYHKIRSTDYDHLRDVNPQAPGSGNLYPAFLMAQDFDQDDVNLRVTWRPLMQLTLVSRYDYQISDLTTRSGLTGGRQHSEIENHVLSQSVTWSPLSRMYVQGSIHYIWDVTETSANDIQVAGETLVPEFRNDYWNTQFVVGYSLDRRTDITCQYLFYKAANYDNNSSISQPYGAEFEEHGVTTTLTRRIRPNLRWTLKYGYFTNNDHTSGGNNDYDSHLVYSGMQYFF